MKIALMNLGQSYYEIFATRIAWRPCHVTARATGRTDVCLVEGRKARKFERASLCATFLRETVYPGSSPKR